MQIILAERAMPYGTNELFEKFGIGISLAPSRREARPTRRPIAVDSAADTIYTGSRNNTLMSLGGTMHHRNMSRKAIQAALMATNETQLDEPLPVTEVIQIVDSVMRYPTAPEDRHAIRETFNDLGNANRFVKMHKAVLNYVLERGNWIVWQDDRWITDYHGVYSMAMVKVTVDAIFLEGIGLDDVDLLRAISRHAANSHNSPRIKAMLDLATRDPQVCVPASVLDADVMRLGLANGVLNLTTGGLEQNSPELRITRYSDVTYDKKAKCPSFLKFLNKIFEGDKAKIAFIRRVVGYCLTGRTDEQVYFFFYGFGANGKTTLLRVIEMLLGSDLVKQTPAETLMAKAQPNKQSNDLARLQGVRVVIANEVEDGSLLAEAVVKQITGGDNVTARFLHKEFFEYRPEFKLIIAGNHKPIIKSTDNGIWRRTILVDFPVSIPKAEQDPALLEKLKAELPGILNWAVSGLRISRNVTADFASS